MGHRHTEEFRRDAVRIALTSGLTRKQVASDLGVGFSTLANWILKSKPEDIPPSADLYLAKETRLLKEEWDFLQKATVFFAELSK